MAKNIIIGILIIAAGLIGYSIYSNYSKTATPTADEVTDDFSNWATSTIEDIRTNVASTTSSTINRVGTSTATSSRATSTPASSTPRTNMATSTQSSSQTDGGVASASFTLADIAGHNQRSDCWAAVNGSVYNVTEFIPNHPGGEAIVQACGKDASQLFGAQPEHVRTNALSVLANYKIGTLRQ